MAASVSFRPRPQKAETTQGEAAFRPKAERAAQISREGSAFHRVIGRGKSALKPRPIQHRMVVQATRDLGKKYNWIDHRIGGLKHLPPEHRQRIIDQRETREAEDRCALRYLGPLGEGTYSAVHKVEHEGEQRAVKLSVGAAYEYNQKEVGYLYRLQRSPYVPRICHYGFDSAPREFAFVLELVPENFYRMYIKQHKTLPLLRIQTLAHEMAQALIHFKNEGIVHADLKPENFSFADQLKIFDFGLAFPPGQETRGNVQSAFYRAPEVFSRLRPYSHPIDMWSFACILFEAYYGYPLFVCDDTEAGTVKYFSLVNQLIGPPPRWYITDPRTPPAIKRLFVWDPAARKCVFMGAQAELEQGLKSGYASCIHRTAAAKGDDPNTAHAFIDFLRQILRYEGRMTPERALEHPFLRGSAPAGE